MSERPGPPADLGMTRLAWAFAVLAVLLLALLALAPALGHFSEWRDAQRRYGRLAAAESGGTLEPRIHQVWKPRLGVTDRCASCHVGMGLALPLASDRLFRAHPAIPHDPSDFGCTLCHGGQGRATTRDDAHGAVAFWDEPMLPAGHYGASCGACHTHAYVPSADLGPRGEALFRRYDCLACHRLDGKGSATGSDLSAAGLKGFPADWHERHLARRKDAREPAWKDSYGDVPASDAAAISEFLRGRAGSPDLSEAKALAHRLGCRGCHRINGKGGTDGPDLTAEGLRRPSDLDFSGVRGPRTLANWMTEHFLDPAAVVKDSRMPNLGLAPDQARLLTTYMLSLRPADLPQSAWPRDRIAAVRLGAPEMAADGATLYGAYCAGCHGAAGEGHRYGNQGVVFPAIGNPDFLAVADDAFLKATVAAGRPGRRMAAWGGPGGVLSDAEVDAVVGHVRGMAPGTPVEGLEALPAGDPARGEARYAALCAGCHGARGEGGEAPSIGSPAFLAAASDTYIQQTVLRGRTGTQMRHFGRAMLAFPMLDPAEVADVTAWLRTLAPAPEARKEVPR